MSKPEPDNPPSPLLTQPRNRPLRSQGYDLPPSGPLHHMHRRHFAAQTGIGTAITLVAIGVAVWFIGKDGGIWRALFGK